MNKRFSILLILFSVILTLAACEKKSLPANMGTDKVNELLNSTFPIPAGLSEGSNITWSAADGEPRINSVVIDLIVSDAASVDYMALANQYQRNALTVNKAGQVVIETINLRVNDMAKNQLMTMDLFWNGQSFDRSDWTAEMGGSPAQPAPSTDPNSAYPIDPNPPVVVPPVEEPSPYPTN